MAPLRLEDGYAEREVGY